MDSRIQRVEGSSEAPKLGRTEEQQQILFEPIMFHRRDAKFAKSVFAISSKITETTVKFIFVPVREPDNLGGLCGSSKACGGRHRQGY